MCAGTTARWSPHSKRCIPFILYAKRDAGRPRRGRMSTLISRASSTSITKTWAVSIGLIRMSAFIGSSCDRRSGGGHYSATRSTSRCRMLGSSTGNLQRESPWISCSFGALWFNFTSCSTPLRAHLVLWDPPQGLASPCRALFRTRCVDLVKATTSRPSKSCVGASCATRPPRSFAGDAMCLFIKSVWSNFIISEAIFSTLFL